MSAAVHILSIKPDLSGATEEGDEMDHEDGEGGGSDYDAHLSDAWDAAQEKDKEGFIAAMRAAIKSCIAEYESTEDEKPEEKEEEY